MIVVTGASGHVGNNLIRALLADGRKVRAVIREDARALADLDVERARADVLDPPSLKAAFAGAEVVFHLAGLISISGRDSSRLFETNVLGPRNVANACLEAGVRRLVHFSSIHALSPLPPSRTVDETSPPSIGDRYPAYDRSKAGGELEIQSAVRRGLDAVIVNPTSVIGPHDYKLSHMGDVFYRLYHRRLPALMDGGFNWVDVRDVAAGAMAAEQRGRTGERYLLAGHWTTVRVLAEEVERASGVKPPRFDAPAWLARFGAPYAALYDRLRGRRPLFTAESIRALGFHRHISHAKAERELGYQPRPLSETVADTIAWFRDGYRP